MRKFYLPYKKPDEKTILLIRRHWLALLLRIGFWAILGIIPLMALLFGNYFAITVDSYALKALLILFISIYYLFIWLFIFNGFIDYYLDVWIVTNERIISIEQKQIFSRVVSEQKLSRIQDVTAEVQGILSTFFHLGNVHIQTAGETARFIFKQVPDPYEVARKISNLAELKRRNQKIEKELDEKAWDL